MIIKRKILSGLTPEFAASENLRYEVPHGTDLLQRLDSVLNCLYAMFNEGYYSSCEDRLIKKDICLEVVRLGRLLAEHPNTSLPVVHAFNSLVCLQSSRIDSRINEDGCLVLLEDQDRTNWDQSLILEGIRYLGESSMGESLSRFHLEAGEITVN